MELMLEREKVAKDALKFYGSRNNWGDFARRILEDCGDKAKEALERLK